MLVLRCIASEYVVRGNVPLLIKNVIDTYSLFSRSIVFEDGLVNITTACEAHIILLSE